MAAGDGRELERCPGAGDVRDEPFGDAADVDSRHLDSWFVDAVAVAHAVPRVAITRG